ncbi:MAG: 4Fe-4S binding protein [Intestinimonas sp.]|jgi:dissimilatory sulfite reductase (desulfoviridin) alpha/beta subunit/predicted Fe-Mo cluster-binding NifX family protein|nr:4Fe-4S binding protein [Intestinimonas sp.]
MKLAVTYENGAVFQHFSHTQTFKLYTIRDGIIAGAELVPTGGNGQDALAGFLASRGVDTLICGNIDPDARQTLKQAGIRLYCGVTGSADAAAAALLAGNLSLDSPPARVCRQEHGDLGPCHHNVRASETRGETPPVSPEDIAQVKGLGFLHDKRSADLFNGRVITGNGRITSKEARAIAEAAERFGNGEMAMTTRLSVEIQGVPFDQIEPMRAFLAQYGLETGGTGPKVRPVVSCKGTSCQYGLIDTFALSRKIHQRFYLGMHEVKLPHKFKIAVGGCPNNCVKPDLNDLGIVGQRVPAVDLEKCRGCKVCQVAANCPVKVPQMVDGKVFIDPARCMHCGRCIRKCPFHALSAEITGYRIYIGGRWGKRAAQGRALDRIFTDQDEVLDLVEKVILFFRDNGQPGERFADTVSRIGFDTIQAQLLENT